MNIINLDSIESCTAFSEYLDEQSARVREGIEQLNSLAHTRALFKQFVDSEAFEQPLSEPANPT